MRTAIAALTAVLISFFFHLQTPYWSGMTVVVVTNLYTGSIIDRAFMRLIGTIAGAFLGLYVAHFVANDFFLYILSCFLIICVSVYFYNFSKYSYAYLLMALCAFIVVAQLSINPHNVLPVAIWRPVEIGIGVLVSAVSVYCFFPNHLRNNISTQISALFDELSNEMNQLALCLDQEHLYFTDLCEKNVSFKKNLRKAFELIDAMSHEFGATQEQIDELRAILDSFYELARQIQYLIIAFPEKNDLTAMGFLPIATAFEAIGHDLGELKNILIYRQATNVEFMRTPLVLAEFKRKYEDSQVNNELVNQVFHFLIQINQQLMDIHALSTGEFIAKNSSFKLIRREKRLQTDPDLIKHSLKAGMSVLLALWFWLLSNWPGGLNGIISSLIISIKRNLFEMKNISLHRVLGCLLGGGTALLSLYCFQMNLYYCILVLFFSVWGFTYFMFKVPQYAYVGLQANIALIITLAQEGGPPMVLSPPLQRLGGIFIGIAASFIVGNMIWRSDALSVLSRYLRKLYFYLVHNLRQILLIEGEQRPLYDLATLFWNSRGLIESLREERLSPKKRIRLDALVEQLKSLVSIQATISHIISAIDKDRVVAVAKVLDFDLKHYEERLLLAYEKRDKEEGMQLSKQFIGLASDMEKHPDFCDLDLDSIRGFLAYIRALNQLAIRIG